MFYNYECSDCGEITEIQCTIAEMKREIDCPKCKGKAKKTIEAPVLVGLNNAAFKKEMIKRNVEAGKKMRGSHVSAKDLGFKYERG